MIYEVFQHRLIYIFGIDDAAHRGILKIGDTTITTNKNLPPNCKELNEAAIKRIREYTTTAGTNFRLLYTELAVDNKKNSFRDYDVHHVLKKSGVKKQPPPNTKAREWFKVDLQTAIRAISAVKQGKTFISGIKHKIFREEIIFRPEQDDAIKKTVDYFKIGDKFLWNAKMRFGKTLCALEVVRRMNFSKTIIITHRPVVKKGWFDDFDKIFPDKNFLYGSRDGKNIEDLIASGKNFVYFASIQDLRGSQAVDGKFDKNSEVFKTKWDFVIVDEAHEGTQTALGDAVIKKLVKKKTKFLALSGTPFNLLDDFGGDNVYTWDYVMEQQAKADWDKNHFGDSNPYDELPQMNIFTYNLGKIFNYVDTDEIFFNFREFFKTQDGKFVHEGDVKSFLDLLVTKNDNNYPFSRADFRKMFKHTFWIIPGVKEGLALSKLLKNHEVFRHFEIVNVAGDGDPEDKTGEALKAVQDAIENHEYTITISCGKLTAGVTVPEWTAVFMLAGGYSTSAASYLQTIFRVQTPCNKNGVSKRNAYVFDFAPDRTLKVIADSVRASTRAGKTSDNQREALNSLLKFCPVIAIEGSEMKNLDANKLLKRVKHIQAERAVQNGFEDNNIYNDTLRDLSELDLKKFAALKKIIGTSKPTKKPNEVPINDQGIPEENEGTFKHSRPRTPEETEIFRKNEVKRNAISILRVISVRIPLLIYGADVPFDEDITVEKFIEIVDDASWAEFMPSGLTKEFFKEFIKHYDPEVFVEAGHIIRERALLADNCKISERIEKIAALFATFKNPDKETVLTPWNVVKLHIDSVFDENFFTQDKKILDINAKTGLYPLYVAYKLFKVRLGEVNEKSIPLDELRRLWDKTIAENVFVICKTPMAKTITRRTLLGYRDGSINAHCFDDLINLLKNKPEQFVKRVLNKNFWNKGVGKMFFDAVVGNPPYQLAGKGDNKTFAEPIYNFFIETSQKLADKATLITPARFLSNQGATPTDFRKKILANEHFKVIKHFLRSQDVFPTSDIKGGVVITLFDANQTFKPIGLYIPFDELISIHKKVVLDNKNFRSFSEIVYPRADRRLSKKYFEDFPDSPLKNCDAIGTNAFEKTPEIFFDEKPSDGHEYIQILGRQKNRRVFKWIRRDYVQSLDNLDKWKVFIPSANGCGALGEVLVTPLVGSPLVGSTETFTAIGAFDSEAEAQACYAYIKSKFCRVMLGILKVTQHNPPATWAYVPLQDFTSASDINWGVSIPEIDAQLYRKYNLSPTEIKFIEDKVKAME